MTWGYPNVSKLTSPKKMDCWKQNHQCWCKSVILGETSVTLSSSLGISFESFKDSWPQRRVGSLDMFRPGKGDGQTETYINSNISPTKPICWRPNRKKKHSNLFVLFKSDLGYQQRFFYCPTFISPCPSRSFLQLQALQDHLNVALHPDWTEGGKREPR